jgi:hypothetical protein
MNGLFFDALTVSGYGMLGIFAFMAIFYAVILLLIRWFPYKEDKSPDGAK